MKLCKDCKYALVETALEHAKCGSPRIRRGAVNLVTGGLGKAEFSYCSTQRLHSGIVFVTLFKQCGRRGRYFETKDAPASDIHGK